MRKKKLKAGEFFILCEKKKMNLMWLRNLGNIAYTKSSHLYCEMIREFKSTVKGEDYFATPIVFGGYSH